MSLYQMSNVSVVFTQYDSIFFEKEKNSPTVFLMPKTNVFDDIRTNSDFCDNIKQ